MQLSHIFPRYCGCEAIPRISMFLLPSFSDGLVADSTCGTLAMAAFHLVASIATEIDLVRHVYGILVTIQ